jgi:N utilization substance protein A
MKNEYTLAFNEIMSERSLSRDVVLKAIEQALVNAYKRDAQITTRQRIEANVDAQGQPHIFVEKEVVTSIISQQTEVLIEEAQALHPEAQVGDMVMMPVTNTSANFGRIAAQTAKQVILQRIREAERKALYDEFIEREGDIVTGTIQNTNNKVITLSLGRAEAIMPKQHQIPGEKYRPHDKIRTYVVEVSESSRGPQIIVSRAHKDMLRRLLEYEVPEIYNGQVEIRNIAREAGQRSKVAVVALQEGIDPVGACVGMRGMRIQNIIKELHNEKIDVIEWDNDPKKLIAKALSPARVDSVFLDEDIDQLRTATVIVSDDQLSLAIGKEGQNARLAAKLTGWRIDIKSLTEAALENYDLYMADALVNLDIQRHANLLAETGRIIEKKRQNRAVTPEEFTTLSRFVEVTETSKMAVRREDRSVRRERLDSVRMLVPERAFKMPIEILELAEDITRALRGIENVGELMVRVLSDEERLVQTLKDNKAGDDAMDAIRFALDDLVIPELERIEEDESEPEMAEADLVAPAQAEAAQLVKAETITAESALEELPEAIATPDTDLVADEPLPEEEIQLIEDELTPEMWPEDDDELSARRRKQAKAKPKKEKEREVFLEAFEEPEWEEPEPATSAKKPKKKDKRKRVDLVYDEDLGEVVAKRRRKGSRRRNEFDDYGEF